ncbi:MAG: DoxX family protein [Imperialibacter sp.]|uniref:DoxX family protein n=1 Tax=Imperialibacter sp. TaxID=2038411 RepID=UPI0032EE00BB
MKRVLVQLERIETKWIQLLDKYAFDFLRISIGLIYTAFGLLKFFPQYSPAEQLAEDTICIITFDVLSGNAACIVLAIMETMIGVALIINFKARATILITIWHMCCTFLPLIILPKYAFNQDPFSLSIVGQYIFKNLIILSALMVLYKNLGSKVSKYAVHEVTEEEEG